MTNKLEDIKSEIKRKIFHLNVYLQTENEKLQSEGDMQKEIDAFCVNNFHLLGDGRDYAGSFYIQKLSQLESLKSIQLLFEKGENTLNVKKTIIKKITGNLHHIPEIQYPQSCIKYLACVASFHVLLEILNQLEDLQ